MENQLLHTPEGVRDLYGSECARKLAVQKQLHQIFHLYGYRDIETPVFEFFDVFRKERGSAGSREMYKLFDRDNNTLVLRPDMTPSIARCVAKYFPEEELPVRLCYAGPTFSNTGRYQGRLKESTQTGAELVGDDTSDADAEMIALVIQSLLAAGLKEFQVELGEVEFYRGLVEESGMTPKVQEALRELIEEKNYFGVEELLSRQSMEASLKALFLKLPELFGDIGQIRLASSMTENKRALNAIRRLERIQEILDLYGLGDYVSYDLGMLSKYSYYTGIIFKAYTYGTGDYVVTGGRYNRLLEQFGRQAPAVGFAIMLDQLLLALSRQKIPVSTDQVHTAILYDEDARKKAIRLAGHFRKQNMAVQLMKKPEDKEITACLSWADCQELSNLLYLKGTGDDVLVYPVKTGQPDVVPYASYLPD